MELGQSHRKHVTLAAVGERGLQMTLVLWVLHTRLHLAGEGWPPKLVTGNTYLGWQHVCLKNRRDRDRRMVCLS